MEIIAEKHLEARHQNGEKRAIRIALSKPYQDTAKECWVCEVVLDGMDVGLSRPICGEDSLQALCLAIRIATAGVSIFVEQGWQLFITPGGDASIDVDLIFGHS